MNDQKRTKTTLRSLGGPCVAHWVGVFLIPIIVTVAIGFATPARANPARFDQATVEDLALSYVEESIRRLHIPLLLRIMSIGHDNPSRQEMIDKARADPPKADKEGIVYPFGSSNDMSFVYEPETCSMLVNERMIKTRGRMTAWGLTVPEHAAALNAASSPRERAGATFVYDPYRDSLALQLRYDDPPSDRKRFYKEMDNLKKVGLRWTNSRFMDKSNEVVSKRVPPLSATAEKDGFQATVLLRHFWVEPDETPWSVKRFLSAWHRPDGYLAPRLVTDHELPVGRKMYAFVLFKGVTENSEGVAQVGASFRLIAPDGSVRLDTMHLLLWNAPARPVDHLQVGINNISFRIQDEPFGTYRVEADVCDVATNRCVKLVHPFELLHLSGTLVHEAHGD